MFGTILHRERWCFLIRKRAESFEIGARFFEIDELANDLLNAGGLENFVYGGFIDQSLRNFGVTNLRK